MRVCLLGISVDKNSKLLRVDGWLAIIGKKTERSTGNGQPKPQPR